MGSNNALTQSIGNLIEEIYKPEEPGAAIIVVRNGEIIFRKGQGMANLELGVPIGPDMVFRLGSITKQFTAVAILMLYEQGKLDIDDPIVRFLPDYPTHDHHITIEHLLTHTSGIMSYTSMPEWESVQKKDFTVQEMVDFFMYKPMQFEPGKRWAYNNSGYFLLGAIIEKVSGQTYEQFIQQNIFEPLGLKHSFYDNTVRVIPQRASGYAKGPDGYTNAAYISMTQPYAAGALASTVDDLAHWDAALYTEQLLKQETLQRAFVPYRLADGAPTDYGYGWGISEYEGHRLIEHGGGIDGFRSYGIRMPDDRIFVAALSNNECRSPELLAFKIATLVIGQPYQEPTPVEVSPEVLDQYAGLYQVSSTDEYPIKHEDNQLFLQFGQGPRMELVPFSTHEFFFKDNPLYHFTFSSDADGRVTTLKMHGRSGVPDIAKRVDMPLQDAS